MIGRTKRPVPRNYYILLVPHADLPVILGALSEAIERLDTVIGQSVDHIRRVRTDLTRQRDLQPLVGTKKNRTD
jgi:hypothetical protein